MIVLQKEKHKVQFAKIGEIAKEIKNKKTHKYNDLDTLKR